MNHSRTPPGPGCINTSPIIFYDRRGNVVSPDAQSIIKPRRGAFALAVAVEDRAVMLAAERCAPDVPELPGGGIEAGETLDEATEREWAEEVGIAFNGKGPCGSSSTCAASTPMIARNSGSTTRLSGSIDFSIA
jgi:hypothetical protein